MKTQKIVLVVVLVLMFSSAVLADNINLSTSPSGFYSVGLMLFPDVTGDVAVVLDHNMSNKSLVVESQGNMTANGDYEVWEGRKHSGALGIGYRVGVVTPWVAMSTQSVKTTKYEMKIKDSELIKTETDITEPLIGFSFGLNAEYWMDRLGVSGMVAKVPEGIMANARLKYRVAGIGTAHIGYLYNGYLGHGIIAGLGVAY